MAAKGYLSSMLSDDPAEQAALRQGILSAGFGLLASAGGQPYGATTAQALGQAGLYGMQSYQDALAQQQQAALEKQQMMQQEAAQQLAGLKLKQSMFKQQQEAQKQQAFDASIGQLSPEEQNMARLSPSGYVAGKMRTPPMTFQERMQLAAAGRSPGTNITLNTGDKTTQAYGKALANQVAQDDIALYDAARGVPQLVDNANRMERLLGDGKLITGSGAALRLQMLKVAKQVGVTTPEDNEMIANTENLVRGLADHTLSAIKSSGLGTGQGFTEKDAERLMQARSGTVDMDAATLREVVKSIIRGGVYVTDNWNRRAKNIPSEVAEGIGFDASPIELPAVTTTPVTPPATPPATPSANSGWSIRRIK